MVMPLMIPGMLSGNMILEKASGTPLAPRSLAALIMFSVDLHQHIVNRKHHERQEVVDHAEDDGTGGVDDRPGSGRCRKERMLLMTPFFSRSVCHARVRSRKFIHMGRMKMQYHKAALADLLSCYRIMASG